MSWSVCAEMYCYSREKLDAVEWVLMLSFDIRRIRKHTQLSMGIACARELERPIETMNDGYILQGVWGSGL